MSPSSSPVQTLPGVVGVPGAFGVTIVPPLTVVPPPVGFGVAVTLGDAAFVVNCFENRLERMRRRKRAVVLSGRNARSVSGTTTRICLAVASVLLANTAREPSRLNTTVFLFLPRLKLRPRMTMVSPTLGFIGRTEVTTGYFLALAAAVAVPATAGTSSAVRAAPKAAGRAKWRMRARSSITPGYRPVL